MTRWSFRRRHGVTQDAERGHRPDAAPVTGRPAAAPPPAGQAPPERALTGQPVPGPHQGNWFEPGWNRPAQQGAVPAAAGPYPQGDPDGGTQYGLGQPGGAGYGSEQHGAVQYAGALSGFAPQPASQPAPGQYGTDQYGTDQYGGGQYGADPYGARQPGSSVAVLAPAGPAAPAATPAPAMPASAPHALARHAAAPSAAVPELAPAEVRAEPGDPALQLAGGPWPDICDQFGLHLLVLAEQLRASLDELEADEGDPERLKRLYQVDHAVTRMRRASRDLRTLAGRSEEELAGFTTSLLDVIRMAASAIERYTQVTIGKVADLAVLGYAADDIGSAMAVLLDNATRYSPGTVSVSCHLLEDGGAMFRIEDTGIGMGAEQVMALNAAFAGAVPDVDERTGRHTGFPVVHRIARKHSIGVRLAARPLPSSGTVAMVTLPPHLLCEVPAEEVQRRPAPPVPVPPQAPSRPSVVPDLPRGEPARAHPLPQWAPPDLPARDPEQAPERAAGDLPRRERASLRGDEPRPERQAPGMVPTPEQQAAARRAFADDLDAFSTGTGAQASVAGPAGNDLTSVGDGEVTATTATEEEAEQ